MNFVPRTALFTVKAYIAPESSVEKVKISRVKVTFDGKDSNGQAVNVTGDCALNL